MLWVRVRCAAIGVIIAGTVASVGDEIIDLGPDVKILQPQTGSVVMMSPTAPRFDVDVIAEPMGPGHLLVLYVRPGAVPPNAYRA
jgi:hypothetical protein